VQPHNRKQKKREKARRYFVSELQEEDIGRPFSKAELIDDINFMVKTMEEVHPNLYFHIPKEQVYSLLERIKTSIHDGFDRIEFYVLLAELVAKFHDGHTSVQAPNEDYFKYKNAGGLLFPFDIDCSLGKMVITLSHCDDKLLYQDAVITSIDERPADKILNSMVSLRGFARREINLKSISLSFQKYMYILFGGKNTFAVSIKKDSNLKEYEVSGVSFDLIEKNRRQNTSIRKEPYSFVISKDEGYAILDFQEFVNLNKFKQFAHKLFEEIESDGVTKLIVDLRKNGGGNSQLTEEFISYITDKPYRQFSRVDLKVSKLIRKYYSVLMKHFSSFPINLLPARITYAPLWKTQIGGIASSEVPFKAVMPKQHHFSGNLIVLTSSYTFSAATGFAVTIKDNSLGTIIGTPTGGFPSTYGDSFLFSLPNTCLLCAVSHKFFVRPNGNEAPEPLYPDYLIEESEPNAKTDKVPEFAIHMKLNDEKDNHQMQ